MLDEATSALDNRTERAVQEALDRLAEGRTTIAIAHQLSTVRDAEQIVVLDGGHAAERGTHAELLGRGGRYAALSAREGGEADPPPLGHQLRTHVQRPHQVASCPSAVVAERLYRPTAPWWYGRAGIPPGARRR